MSEWLGAFWEWLSSFTGHALGKSLLIVIITTYVAMRFQRWSHKRLWKLDDPLSITISISTSGIHYIEKWPMTGIGQVRALAHLTPSPLIGYPNANVAIYPSQRMTTDKVLHDLVVLGGGRTNATARDILEGTSKNTSI